MKYKKYNTHHTDINYSLMPKEPKQDNKNPLSNYPTNYYNSNTIRYPKKCRKTAWKRFYKLFPVLKYTQDKYTGEI